MFVYNWKQVREGRILSNKDEWVFFLIEIDGLCDKNSWNIDAFGLMIIMQKHTAVISSIARIN